MTDWRHRLANAYAQKRGLRLSAEEVEQLARWILETRDALPFEQHEPVAQVYRTRIDCRTAPG